MILSPLDDVHAQVVSARLDEMGQSAAIVDLADVEEFGVRTSRGASVLALDGVTVDARTAVWWRRPATPRRPRGVWETSVAEFVDSEWRHALYGGIQASGAAIVNDPVAEGRAAYKINQLRVARDAGLNVPATLVTNHAARARAFAHSLRRAGKRVVYKALTAPRYHMAETRLLGDAIEDDVLALAPVIFQECIERGRDVRVTVVGDDLFAADVRTEHSDLVDWRADLGATFAPTAVPPEVRTPLLRLVARLGLLTGSCDFRVAPSGEWYFLEINPSGQFLFLEADCGWPVSRALAHLLVASPRLPHAMPAA